MTYFRVQHMKHGQQHRYDFVKVEGNTQTHIGTKFLPQKLSAKEVELLRCELKRIHAEKNLLHVKSYNESPQLDPH